MAGKKKETNTEKTKPKRKYTRRNEKNVISEAADGSVLVKEKAPKHASKWKYPWDKIKEEWLGGKSPAQLEREFELPKNLIYIHARKWVDEGYTRPDDKLKEIAESEEITELSLEERAFEQIWSHLDKYQLTEQQKLFVLSYAKNPNKMEAAKKAGYRLSGATADLVTNYLLNDANINSAISYIRGQMIKGYAVQPSDVVNTMTKLFFSDMSDYIEDFGYKTKWVATRQGGYEKDVPYIKLKDKKDMDMSLVKSMKVGQSGDIQIELFDKKMAFDFFIELFGILKQKEENINENKLATGLLAMAEFFKTKK